MKFLVKHLITQGKYGAGNKKADSFDPEQVRMGIAVEREHSDLDAIALKIALDHLAEIPDYYTRLAKMESDAKAELGLRESDSEVKTASDIEAQIREYIKTHPNLDDSEFHEFVNSLGMDEHEGEEIVYNILHELLKSGD